MSSAAREALQGALQRMEERLSEGARGMSREFQAVLWSGDTLPSAAFRTAQHPGNKTKNRYTDVLPLEHNRILLRSGASGEYINASPIASRQGETPAWRYIATQGPLDATVCDFWQMVWEQDVTTVLMLTNFAEGRMAKCADYLGIKKSMRRPGTACSTTYGDFQVDLQTCAEQIPGIMQRTLVLQHLPSGTSRQVQHYHFYEWDDHGVPENPRALRALLSALRGQVQAAPTVVHCSAGIGRTGTLIAVDVALRRLYATQRGDAPPDPGAADISALVAHMRQQRPGMVQTAEQYYFCHRAVRDELEEILASRGPN